VSWQAHAFAIYAFCGSARLVAHPQFAGASSVAIATGIPDRATAAAVEFRIVMRGAARPNSSEIVILAKSIGTVILACPARSGWPAGARSGLAVVWVPTTILMCT